MKRPQHMTMRELIALPILSDSDEVRDAQSLAGAGHYGGAFRDEDGYVWGTLRTPAGWARFPAYLPLMQVEAPVSRARRFGA